MSLAEWFYRKNPRRERWPLDPRISSFGLNSSALRVPRSPLPSQHSVLSTQHFLLEPLESRLLLSAAPTAPIEAPIDPQGTEPVVMAADAPVVSAAEPPISPQADPVAQDVNFFTAVNTALTILERVLIAAAFPDPADALRILGLSPMGTSEHGDLIFVVVGTDLAFRYTPDADFTGTDSVPFVAGFDTGQLTGPFNVNFNVGTPPNQPPTANPDSEGLVVPEGGTLTVPAPGAPGVLANDTDPENDPLTAEPVAGPQHAAVFTLNPDGSFTYTHDGSETTSDSFQYMANDGQANSMAANVTITITPVNDPPVANPDADTISEDPGQLSVTGGVLENDTDADGPQAPFVSQVNGSGANVGLNITSAFGILEIDANGDYFYTLENDLPAVQRLRAGETVEDRFTYTASDGVAERSSTLTITIVGTNDQPVAVSDGDALAPIVVTKNQPLDIDVVANDLDVDGPMPLVPDNVSDPEHGTATVVGGLVRYTPDAEYVGPDSFTYRAKDGAEALSENAATVTVFVEALPTVDIDDEFRTEGTSLTGTTPFVFNLTLSHPSKRPVTVEVATVDVEAKAGEDYTPIPQDPPFTVTFAPSETTKTVTVHVQQDDLFEPVGDFTLQGEKFLVVLTRVENATLGKNVGVGEILDDDVRELSIDHVTKAEGALFEFTLTLSRPTIASEVSVGVATSLGTATPGLDYQTIPADPPTRVTFGPGETMKRLPVEVFDDLLVEDLETFSVTLSKPFNAFILGNGIGIGTITANDDADRDSVADAVEDGAPSGGDGNKDGIKDSEQPNVASLNAATGPSVTFDAPDGTTFSDVDAIEDLPASPPAGVILPFGLFSFAVEGGQTIAPGEKFEIDVILDEELPQDEPPAWFKLDPRLEDPTPDDFVNFEFDGDTGAQFSDDDGNGSVDRVHLTIRDGGRGDLDGTANGRIEDPGGPAFSVTLDVDGDGVASMTDGTLSLRYLGGMPDGQLTAGMTFAVDATRITGGAIRSRLDLAKTLQPSMLDADGDGLLNPFTDGRLLFRYLQGADDMQLLAGSVLGTSATRQTASEIRVFLDQFQPTLGASTASSISSLSTAVASVASPSAPVVSTVANPITTQPGLAVAAAQAKTMLVANADLSPSDEDRLTSLPAGSSAKPWLRQFVVESSVALLEDPNHDLAVAVRG